MTFLRRFSDNTVATLLDAPSIAIDMVGGPHFQVTLEGNRTLANPTNDDAAKEVLIVVAQDVIGGRTLAFDSSWIAVDPSAAINSAASSVSVISATARDFGSGVKWYYTIVHANETVGWDHLEIPGAHSQTITSNQLEVVVGAFYLDPTVYEDLIVNLQFVGEFTTADTLGSGELRLYDTGPGTGFFSPVRRATRSIAYANAGERRLVTGSLALTASPGVNSDQIHNVARTYELRLYINTASVPSTLTVAWGGLVITK